jgi:6-pyruvoyltetrahydropterin/6-carboxytetrahydropterin synthase
MKHPQRHTAGQAMFELQFVRKWEAAHRFIEGENRGTLCAQPHGHTWSVEVRLSSPTPVQLNGSTNTVILFHKVKKTWHQFVDRALDHSFMCHHRDPILEFLRKDNPEGRFVITPGDPTTETLAVCLKAKLEAILASESVPMVVTGLTIYETPTNAVTFTGNCQEALPFNDPQCWWNRADLSTQNFVEFPQGYPIR